MTEKQYFPERGVLLDSSFAFHAQSCESCKRFNAERPETAALLCLEGSVLWKREKAEPAKRKEEWRPPTFVSKAEVKAKMKYKE